MSTFHANIVAGEELPARTFQIDRALLVQYANASGDQNPIHQNEEFAISVGLHGSGRKICFRFSWGFGRC